MNKMFTLKTHLGKDLLKIFLITICCFGFNGAAWGQTSTTDEQNVVYQLGDDGGAYVAQSNEASGDISIPSTITIGSTSYNVTKISVGAFQDNAAITSVIIP